MRITRRHVLAALTASTVLALSGAADAADTVRIGLPTKTYWPTTIAETAVRQKLFEKEGITAELTIYRSGAETFEGMAAGAADRQLRDRKSTRLNSSHVKISYAVFCLKKKNKSCVMS